MQKRAEEIKFDRNYQGWVGSENISQLILRSNFKRAQFKKQLST